MPQIDYKSGISHWKSGTKPTVQIRSDTLPECFYLCKWDIHERSHLEYYYELKFLNKACPDHGSMVP